MINLIELILLVHCKHAFILYFDYKVIIFIEEWIHGFESIFTTRKPFIDMHSLYLIFKLLIGALPKIVCILFSTIEVYSHHRYIRFGLWSWELRSVGDYIRLDVFDLFFTCFINVVIFYVALLIHVY